ncbi:MAG: hypothetical protein HC805_06265 [Alkalinema sp. RL_2_19]|nr:hypothetical protein [Alkalinema sp. RL_2_19]
MITVDTIDDLRQLDITSLNNATAIYVKGYYAPGDHGGGTFIWMPQIVIAIDQDGDGQDEAVDDFGGTILAPASVTYPNQAGRWIRAFDGATLHTLWFGIISNRNQGTDISARLNLAIKRAATISYNDTSGGNTPTTLASRSKSTPVATKSKTPFTYHYRESKAMARMVRAQPISSLPVMVNAPRFSGLVTIQLNRSCDYPTTKAVNSAICKSSTSILPSA